MKNNKFIKSWLIIILMIFCINISGCNVQGLVVDLVSETEEVKNYPAISIDEIPEYSGEPYVVINNNVPDFDENEKNTESYEFYSDLDSLGRCGAASANIEKALMPTEERGKIGQIKPSGWHTVKYDIIDGMYLYNRCHLIGYQLTGENSNEKNLITGTRYMNTKGMLPFENQVAHYIEETGNHVLYRATPIFYEDDLLARGVQMEAYSVEDNGEGISFNVFVYNVQPGIFIDYATGESSLNENEQISQDTDTIDNDKSQDNTSNEVTDGGVEQTEIRGNSNSMIYHCPGQMAYEQMATSKYLVIFQTEQEAIDAGYRKAKR